MSISNPYILPSQQYKQRVTIFSVSAIIVCLACIYMNFNPFMLFTEFHYVVDLLKEMFPANYKVVSDNASIPYSILLTIAMAFLGTLYGGIIAIILAFLSASNIISYKIIRSIVSAIISFFRVIPSLVVVLIFVIAVGPGPFAGMLTLVILTIGTFGKLFREIIENTENPPGEAIYSVGAARVQVIKYSIIPQILPTLIANLLYAFDVNLRAAIGLGIFGGGGIGFEFHLRRKILGEGKLN